MNLCLTCRYSACRKHYINFTGSHYPDDRAVGLCEVIAAGGTGIAQDPQTATFEVMPQSAIDLCRDVKILTIEEIIKFIIFET